MKNLRITALAGGIGAARLLQGLVRAIPPDHLTVIVNTADDIDFFGLRISPDIDIIIYTLAGVVHPAQGWGFKGDRFDCLEQLKHFGYEDWFKLGDRDLATHIHRAWLLRKGWSLTQVTDSIRNQFHVGAKILPMTNDRVVTKMVTRRGVFHFQEYLVKRKARDKVRQVLLEGADRAKATPEVLRSIRDAEGIILCPSNPIVSIGPILAVKGIRNALRKTRAKIVGISPIVGGQAVKGPAREIMSGIGMEVSATQVAKLYKDFMDVFIIDEKDQDLRAEIESRNCPVIVTDTIMKDLPSKIRLARVVCRALRSPK